MNKSETDGLSCLSAAAGILLTRPLPESSETKRELEALGVEATGAAAIASALLRKACGGDVSAAKLLRELLRDGDGTPEPPPDMSGYSDAELRRLASGCSEEP